MLNPHQLRKAARKAGTARTDQDQKFKKPFQTVGHPLTMDHNMHDDFVRNPPKNVAQSEVVPRAILKWGIQDKTAIPSSLSQDGLGRIKQSDVQSELIADSSVHS